MHAFWVVRCKTPSCDGTKAVRYIGEYEEEVPTRTIPADFPEWFDLECGDCGKVHRYTPVDLKARFFDSPAPPEFRGL